MTEPTGNEWPIPELIEEARSIITWKKVSFRPTDSLVYRRGEGQDREPEIREGGWDHEHCMLCMAEISLFPGAQPDGYADENEDKWVCSACFERYVRPFQQH